MPASPPYFLPAPIGLGTFGAFIRIRAAIRSKRELLEVAVAGPFAGFVALLPFALLGVALSEPVRIWIDEAPRADSLLLYLPGESLLVRAAALVVHGPLAEGVVLNPHPFLLAAWVGLFATMLNLLPLAQLDGGHVLYAAVGRAQRRLAMPLWVGLAAMGLLWSGWWLWCVVVLVLGLRHPPVLDETAPQSPAAIASWRLVDEIGDHRFRQFLFFRQWAELRQHARNRGVRILGDAPIFVAADSADVWSHPEFFKLDEQRRPRVVAGVPPDYFSETGQLWGNPLYDWEVLWRDHYQWWVDRLRAMLDLVDLLRIDHFRGFEAYWEVDAGMPTAEKRRWVPGPNAAFFDKLRAALGGLPILAEDLGVITPEVHALRERLGLPGMLTRPPARFARRATPRWLWRSCCQK